MSSNFVFKSFTLGDWMTNCYFTGLEEEKMGWIFDPGFSPEPLLNFLETGDYKVEKIIFTHSHLDHIAGADEVYSRFPEAEVLIHEAEFMFPQDSALNLSAMVGLPVTGPAPHRALKDGDELMLGDFPCRVFHTPGHSPGGACFYFREQNLLLSGDTLFKESVGRHDFPSSDGEALFRGIKEKLMVLPDDTDVYPGHGPETSIGFERKHNPFL